MCTDTGTYITCGAVATVVEAFPATDLNESSDSRSHSAGDSKLTRVVGLLFWSSANNTALIDAQKIRPIESRGSVGHIVVVGTDVWTPSNLY